MGSEALEIEGIESDSGRDRVVEIVYLSDRNSAKIKFSRVPFRAFFDERLMKSPNYYRVLGILCGHANKQNRVYLFQHTIVNLTAQLSGAPISRRTVCRILKDLEKWEYIEIHTQRGAGRPCEYVIKYATQDDIFKCVTQDDTFREGKCVTQDDTFLENKCATQGGTQNVPRNGNKCATQGGTPNILTERTEYLTECVNLEESNGRERESAVSSSHTHTGQTPFDFLGEENGEELRDLVLAVLKSVSAGTEAVAIDFLREEIFGNDEFEVVDIRAGLLDFQAYCERNGKGPYSWIKDRVERALRSRIENGGAVGSPPQAPISEEEERAYEASLCEDRLMLAVKAGESLESVRELWDGDVSDKPFLGEYEESIFERVNSVFELRERVGAELRRRIDTMKDRRNDPAFNVREYVEKRQWKSENENDIHERLVKNHPLYDEYCQWFKKLSRKEK